MGEASYAETIVFICFIVCLCVAALIFCFRWAMANRMDHLQWLRTRDDAARDASRAAQLTTDDGAHNPV